MILTITSGIAMPVSFLIEANANLHASIQAAENDNYSPSNQLSATGVIATVFVVSLVLWINKAKADKK